MTNAGYPACTPNPCFTPWVPPDTFPSCSASDVVYDERGRSIRCVRRAYAPICPASTPIEPFRASQVAAGRVMFDPVSSAGCLSAIQSGVVDLTRLGSPLMMSPCKVLRGTVPAGQPCHQDYECEAGWCSSRGLPRDFLSSGNVCPGVCVAAAGAGQRCTPSASSAVPACQADLVCDPVTSTCQARPGPGMRCQAGTCQAGLQCDPASSTCKPLQTSGSCDDALERRCAPGYACAASAASGVNACQPILGSGSSCDVMTSHCGLGTMCTSGKLPRAGPGRGRVEWRLDELHYRLGGTLRDRDLRARLLHALKHRGREQ